MTTELRRVEIGIIQFVRTNYLVSKLPTFTILNGHHHKRSRSCSAVFSAYDAMPTACGSKICKNYAYAYAYVDTLDQIKNSDQ